MPGIDLVIDNFFKRRNSKDEFFVFNIKPCCAPVGCLKIDKVGNCPVRSSYHNFQSIFFIVGGGFFTVQLVHLYFISEQTFDIAGICHALTVTYGFSRICKGTYRSGLDMCRAERPVSLIEGMQFMFAVNSAESKYLGFLTAEEDPD